MAIGHFLIVFHRQALIDGLGPIVRINPEEVHISDPNFYDEVYVNHCTRATDKWYWSARQFGTHRDTVSTVDHRVHRHRRAALNPIFSKKSVTALEPRVNYHVDKLVKRLVSYSHTSKIVNLVDVYIALTTDVISDLTLGQSYSFLDEIDFNTGWHSFLMELSKNSHLMKQFHWTFEILELLPRSIISLLNPFLMSRLHSLQDSISATVKSHINESYSRKTAPPITSIVSSLFSSHHLSPADKSLSRLAEEAFVLIGAGTTTTAWALTVATYHVLSNPHILSTLRNELSSLASATPNSQIPWSSYETLPYFNAVINEGLRLSYGTSHRLARISPHEPLQYKEFVIPPGTPVGMTQMQIHLDATIFPRPESFEPERWIIGPGNTDEMIMERKKFLVPFSKGARMCVGMYLAKMELALVLGRLFGAGGHEGEERLELELVGTSVRDVQIERDYFNPVPWEGSQGVRVVMR